MDLDLNLIRSIVTVLAFAAFVALVARVWRAANRERYDEAAALPFADEPEPPSARHPGARRDPPLSAPRPAEAGRPPWGSSKVAKPHLLESTPRPTTYVVRPPRGMSKVAKPHLLMSKAVPRAVDPGLRRDDGRTEIAIAGVNAASTGTTRNE